jgi:predicted DNA repair protein MutK
VTATANHASRANASNRVIVLKAIGLKVTALKVTVRTAQSVRTGQSGRIVRRANGSKANASKGIVQNVPIVMIAVSAMKTANAIASGLPIP